MIPRTPLYLSQAGPAKSHLTIQPTGGKQSAGRPLPSGGASMRRLVYVLILGFILLLGFSATVRADRLPGSDHGARPLIPLTAPVSGSSSGCKRVDQMVLKDILQNPEQYYINVHTTAHPGGAGRGQLTK